jgi:hypothetical protein
MRELPEIEMFHEEGIIFKSIYITLNFCCTIFEFHYLRIFTKFITDDPACLLRCCVVLNLIISLHNSLLLIVVLWILQTTE